MSSKTIAATKWLIRLWKPVLIILMVLLLLNYALAGTSWRILTPGVEYQDLKRRSITPWSHAHVFKINLTLNELSLVMARDLDLKYASADEYARHTNSLITINGGFFDQNFQSLGLRINKKQQQSPFKRISWWGVFYIKGNKAYISSVRQFNRDNQIDFAIQSGPRLLINGQIPIMNAKRAERTALGITKEGNIIIIVTENAPMSTTELAQLMKAPPLNCLNALNLDGGSSSQLYAKINSFRLSVHGFSNVSDAVIVKAKPSLAQ